MAAETNTWTQAGNLWALREGRGLFNKGQSDPVQLTFGPIQFGAPVPSRDGKRLFSVGSQEKGELVRFDGRPGQFVPYLSGFSAYWVASSKDAIWVAYTTFPEGSLWRSRADGTERLQLTFPPLKVTNSRWSPDGKRIAFVAWFGTDVPHIYAIPAAGGTASRLAAGDVAQADASWLPDGRQLLFGTLPEFVARDSPNALIHLLDLPSGRISDLPGSQGLFAPRVSPDGRHVAALSFDSAGLMLFDFGPGKWRALYEGHIRYPEWSRDGRHVYFDAGSDVRRVRIEDGRVEVVASLRDFHRPSDLGSWVGLAADDSPLVLRDLGTHEIYALDWEAP